MKIIKVLTKLQLDELYNQSALTWEGLSANEESLNGVVEWLNEHGAVFEDKEPTFHIIYGEQMNKAYDLTGNNAYPKDLTIVSVTDINQMAVVMPRFQVGGRWFDDVVYNNVRREKGIK